MKRAHRIWEDCLPVLGHGMSYDDVGVALAKVDDANAAEIRKLKVMIQAQREEIERLRAAAEKKGK